MPIKPVFKKCNVGHSGCHGKYNLTLRAEKERIETQKKQGKIPQYKSKYDACDNPNCQKD